MITFKDNFSRQSDIYLKYRPHYPVELYAHLASLTKDHELAWDCGTGNGQAATGLAGYYRSVMATDPSEQQVRNSVPHERVQYLVERAEQTSIGTHSADLVTIANALHWFDFDTFYKEVHRVLNPGGVIAAWCYCLPIINPDVDRIIHHYHYHTLDHLWLPENRMVEQEYTTIPFPFDPIESPPFFSEKSMKREDVVGYLNTWSATQKFIGESGYNPTVELAEELKSVWHDPLLEKVVRWKLTLKMGRVIGLTNKN